MNLRNIMPNTKEVRHKRYLSPLPHTHTRFHLHETSRIDKSIETKSKLVVAKGWEEGGWGMST